MMAFKDSFGKWEPIGGYGWEKARRPLETSIFVWDGLYRGTRDNRLYSTSCAVAFSVDKADYATFPGDYHSRFV